MLTKETLNALAALLQLPVVKGSTPNEVLAGCGGCTSLHHNN